MPPRRTTLRQPRGPAEESAPKNSMKQKRRGQRGKTHPRDREFEVQADEAHHDQEPVTSG